MFRPEPVTANAGGDRITADREEKKCIRMLIFM